MPEAVYTTGSRHLPRLSFPDLRDTCESFTDWAAPFLNGTELAEAQGQVKDFLAHGGEGEALQRTLEETLRDDPSFLGHIPYWDSWYLEQQEPLGPDTNPYYLLDMPPSEPVRRAAELVSSAVAFCLSIADGTIEPDLHGGRPLCMEQYSFIFGAARIPEEGTDRFVSHWRGQGRKTMPRHIAVLWNGKIFSMAVLDKEAMPFKTGAIEKALRAVVSTGRGHFAHAGVLTTLERPVWAHVRKEIGRGHRNNADVIQTIESALFALCLDDGAPASDSEAGLSLLAGSNRWYDKSLQVIVFGNGRSGINFEHSRLDGLPLTRLARFLASNGTAQETASREAPSFSEVSLALTSRLRERISEAEKGMEKKVSRLGTLLLKLPAGRNDVKKCRVSPDAFVQLALLLAGRRHWGRWVSTSGAVMLRFFKEGRTGVMRTLTPEALAFLALMDSPSATPGIRAETMRKASHAHSARIAMCLEGRGPEEHLHALLAAHRCRKGPGAPAPALLEGTAWRRLQDTAVATSTTPPQGLRLAGYGPLSQDGFGGRYMKTDPQILFNMSFWRDSCTEPGKFAETLFACAGEMISVFEEIKAGDTSGR